MLLIHWPIMKNKMVKMHKLYPNINMFLGAKMSK